MTRVQVFSSYFQELCQQSCFASEHYQFVPQTLVIVISPPVEVSHISMKKKLDFYASLLKNKFEREDMSIACFYLFLVLSSPIPVSCYSRLDIIRAKPLSCEKQHL